MQTKFEVPRASFSNTPFANIGSFVTNWATFSLTCKFVYQKI